MFNPDSINVERIKNVQGIAEYAEIIEEAAMLKYGSQQYFANIKA